MQTEGRQPGESGRDYFRRACRRLAEQRQESREKGKERRLRRLRRFCPPIIASRYIPEHIISTVGLQGVVVAARDIENERRVALKILRYALRVRVNPRIQRYPVWRFKLEAHVSELVRHPNLMPIIGSGCDGDLHYLVMPIVEGPNLRNALRRDCIQTWRRAAEITAGLLAGISALHRVGIVHRDVSPQNILIAPDGTVILTDYGYSDLPGQPPWGNKVGTPGFRDPDQRFGERSTPAMDLYATGAVLAWMLQHVTDTPPPALTQVASRAMADTPAERFPNADAMQAALQNAMEAERECA